LAVDRVSFAVREGEIFGLLGPNGAGKTTTIRMLTGLTRPTSGTALVDGLDLARDPIAAKERIGIVSDVASLYDELSAWDNLLFVARLHGMGKEKRVGRAEELLRLFGLYDHRHHRAGTFSTGLKKRLLIAAALVHDPQVLFLDEPTTGLDVQSARLIRELIGALTGKRVTVLLTTHYIEEADQLCQRVAIIHRGQIVAVDTPERLKSLVQEENVIQVSFDQPAGRVARQIQALDHTERVVISGERVTLHVRDPAQVLPSIVDLARECQLEVVSLNTTRPTLEDAFVALTGMRPEAMTTEHSPLEHQEGKR
jgi:ABC-2 type transport system ATP-binding protein